MECVPVLTNLVHFDVFLFFRNIIHYRSTSHYEEFVT